MAISFLSHWATCHVCGSELMSFSVAGSQYQCVCVCLFITSSCRICPCCIVVVFKTECDLELHILKNAHRVIYDADDAILLFAMRLRRRCEVVFRVHRRTRFRYWEWMKNDCIPFQNHNYNLITSSSHSTILFKNTSTIDNILRNCIHHGDLYLPLLRIYTDIHAIDSYSFSRIVRRYIHTYQFVKHELFECVLSDTIC